MEFLSLVIGFGMIQGMLPMRGDDQVSSIYNNSFLPKELNTTYYLSERVEGELIIVQSLL